MAERNSSSSRASERGAIGSTPDSRSATPGTAQQHASGRDQTQHSDDSGLAHKVKERATSQLNTQKDRATEGLGTMAHAVRQSTQQLRDQDHDTIAGYVEQAANQIDRLSKGLKNKDVGELARDAQRLAQKRPALFVGSAFALGLVGARFFKSSSPDEHEYEYGRDRYRGGSAGRGYDASARGRFAGGYTPGTTAGTPGAAGAPGTSRKTDTRTSTAGSASPSSSPKDIRGTGRS